MTRDPEFVDMRDRQVDQLHLQSTRHRSHAELDLRFPVLLLEASGKRQLERADTQFAKPRHPFPGTEAERFKKRHVIWQKVKILEPARLGHFRLHMLKVCELNRETWSFIREETDDDFEWLPNPKQTGILRMPVTNEMIDGWLDMVSEFESLYDGRKVIGKDLIQFVSPSTKKGFNMKAFLDNPPDEFDWEQLSERSIREQYLDDSSDAIDIWKIVRVFSIFQNTLAVGYAAWFN